MSQILTPLEPLSQVVFIHDYLQLVFQGESCTVYNLAKLMQNGIESIQGAPGFCDGLVSLIGQRISAVSTSVEHPLVLTFEGGEQFLVLSGVVGARGSEAFQFINRSNQIIVEQNA